MPAAYGNRNRPYYRRFCPQSGCTTSTSDYRSRTQRSHPQIHRYGRLRRTNEKPRILHGICRSAPPKYSYPYRRLCQIPLQQTGIRRYQRHSACPGRRTMQRQLLPGSYCPKIKRDIRPGKCQRLAHRLQHRLV